MLNDAFLFCKNGVIGPMLQLQLTCKTKLIARNTQYQESKESKLTFFYNVSWCFCLPSLDIAGRHAKSNSKIATGRHAKSSQSWWVVSYNRLGSQHCTRQFVGRSVLPAFGALWWTQVGFLSEKWLKIRVFFFGGGVWCEKLLGPSSSMFQESF